MVLLHKYLALYLKEKGRQKPLSIIKKGSAFLKMYIPKTGIQFVDICDFIGHGFSLSAFCKLTEQNDAKFVFPFKSFTSHDFLQQKNLPSDQESWFNDLSQKQTSQADIERAHSDFKKSKAKNIGEYLEAYLKSKYHIYF